MLHVAGHSLRNALTLESKVAGTEDPHCLIIETGRKMPFGPLCQCWLHIPVLNLSTMIYKSISLVNLFTLVRITFFCLLYRSPSFEVLNWDISSSWHVIPPPFSLFASSFLVNLHWTIPKSFASFIKGQCPELSIDSAEGKLVIIEASLQSLCCCILLLCKPQVIRLTYFSKCETAPKGSFTIVGLKSWTQHALKK